MSEANEKERLMAEHHDEERHSPPPTRPTFLRLALATSLVLNLALGLLWAYAFGSIPEASSISNYARLKWDQTGTLRAHTKFYDQHRYTQSNKEWAALDTDHGVVAISDNEAEHLGLPAAQRFPWDSSKGIYHIGAYHDLHCLVSNLDKSQKLSHLVGRN